MHRMNLDPALEPRNPAVSTDHGSSSFSQMPQADSAHLRDLGALPGSGRLGSSALQNGNCWEYVLPSEQTSLPLSSPPWASLHQQDVTVYPVWPRPLHSPASALRTPKRTPGVDVYGCLYFKHKCRSSVPLQRSFSNRNLLECPSWRGTRGSSCRTFQIVRFMFSQDYPHFELPMSH